MQRTCATSRSHRRSEPSGTPPPRGTGARQAAERRAYSVDSGAVPRRDRDDDQVMIADLDQDAVVAEAVPPVADEIPGDAFTTRAWIVEFAHLIEIGLDAAKHLSIQFACSPIELR